MMDINDYFYNRERDDIYHPFSDYNKDKYFPEVSLTKQLVLIRLIWDDILCLSDIYREQKEPHKRRAILKYMMMDMCSLYDKFQEFRKLIIQGKGIEYEQQKEILERFESFLPKLDNFSKRTNTTPNGKDRRVRNKLSAHRDREVPLSEVRNMWHNLCYKDIEDISKEITRFYNYLKGLGIYQWVKFSKNSTIEIVNDSPFVEKEQ